MSAIKKCLTLYEELTTQILHKYFPGYPSDLCMKWRENIRKARAELAALRADAGRWRELLETLTRYAEEAGGELRRPYPEPYWDCYPKYKARNERWAVWKAEYDKAVAEARAAIDAAMKAGG